VFKAQIDGSLRPISRIGRRRAPCGCGRTPFHGDDFDQTSAGRPVGLTRSTRRCRSVVTALRAAGRMASLDRDIAHTQRTAETLGPSVSYLGRSPVRFGFRTRRPQAPARKTPGGIGADRTDGSDRVRGVKRLDRVGFVLPGADGLDPLRATGQACLTSPGTDGGNRRRRWRRAVPGPGEGSCGRES
jgi:hypothetical protein